MKLPSGRELKITLSDFTTGYNLKKSFLKTVKNLDLDFDKDMDFNFLKDVVCEGLTSDDLEHWMWECAKKATIDDIKMTKDSFEKEEHREDYIVCFYEVVKRNLAPFGKSLFAQYVTPFVEMMTQEGLKPLEKKTQS